MPVRERFERGFRQDLSRVRIHHDDAAAGLAGRLEARACTVGRDIFFGEGRYAPGTAEGTRLLAHELAHAVQQSPWWPGTAGPLAMTSPSDPLEQGAERAAETVVRGGVASPVATATAPVVARSPEAVGRVEGILDSGASMCEAVEETTRALHMLGNAELVETAIELLDARGETTVLALLGVAPLCAADQLEEDVRVLAAFELAVMGRGGSLATRELAVSAARHLAEVSEADRQELIGAARGVALDELTLEGMEALRGAEEEPPSARDAEDVGAAIASTIAPGPWAPPGGQPIPFYIGNAAHVGIAASYSAKHAAQLVFFNTVPLGSIVIRASKELGIGDPSRLSAAKRELRPDIVNLTRLHLYEIKPWRGQAAGVAEATLYAGLLSKAGVPMALGPTAEPGVRGTIPAPAGYYVFWSPVPGVIVYRYGRGPLGVPVPVPVPETVKVREPSFMERMAEITGLTGTALIIYVVISEGSRVFPPRNLVPVP